MALLGTSDLMAFVSTQNSAKAKDFYQNVLGLRFVEDQPFALVFDANGTVLRIAKVEHLNPAPQTVLGWIVHDIAAVVTNLGQKGVICEEYAGLEQDELGIWLSPSGAQIVWFKD